MREVSLLRLYVMRAMYLFIVAGLVTYVWPAVLDHQHHRGIAEGEANCMLAGFSLMCLLGIRYPLQMLPVLLWEVTWKTIWLLSVPLPQWLSGHLDENLKEPLFAISMVVIVYVAVPWVYVLRNYLIAPSERWRRAWA